MLFVEYFFFFSTIYCLMVMYANEKFKKKKTENSNFCIGTPFILPGKNVIMLIICIHRLSLLILSPSTEVVIFQRRPLVLQKGLYFGVILDDMVICIYILQKLKFKLSNAKTKLVHLKYPQKQLCVYPLKSSGFSQVFTLVFLFYKCIVVMSLIECYVVQLSK